MTCGDVKYRHERLSRDVVLQQFLHYLSSHSVCVYKMTFAVNKQMCFL